MRSTPASVRDVNRRVTNPFNVHSQRTTGALGACDGAKQYESGWATAMDSILNDGFSRASLLLGAIGQGIDVSARNHWTADANSAGQAGSPPSFSPVTAHPGPAACGDAPVLTGDPPWWMPGFLAPYVPTADVGRLDAADQTCRAAARQVGDLVSGLHSTLQGLVSNNTSDGLKALEQFWQQAAGPRSILTGLPQALTDVADSLYDFGIWNRDTRQAIQDKIKNAVEGLGIIVAIGSVLSDGVLDVLIAAVVEALDAFGIDAAGTLAAPIAEVAESATARLLIAGTGAVAVAGSIQHPTSNIQHPTQSGPLPTFSATLTPSLRPSRQISSG